MRGLGVSPGIAVGHALVIERRSVPIFRMLVPAEAVEGEVARLQRAVARSREQLVAIRERVSRELGRPHGYIFDAHLLMLDDPLLVERSADVVRTDHVNAEWALRTVSEQLRGLFEGLSDAYLRERGTDLDDVQGRILLNLSGAGDAPSLSKLPGSFVVVADDLLPSEAAELDWQRVLAVATDQGSPTHHTSILARSLGIPAVVGLVSASREVPPGALVVVDGSRGELILEPSAPMLAGFRDTQERARQEDAALQSIRGVPCVTRDGVRIHLLANAEFPGEADTAVQHGAEGIGLFRSEYLLGRSGRWPSEEQQLAVYRGLLERLRPWPVTVRTWDVGADELAPGGPTSANPALGQRASRLIGRDPAPFLAQIRALLRASEEGPLRVMFPFVAGPSDLRVVLDLLAEARASLRAEGRPCGEAMAVGVTLEVPSAAVTADLLAPDVDFFTVGTNDLIQYLLAVDRVDPRVSSLYEPLHPAVLRTIAGIVAAGAAAGVPVSVCGEMASEPLNAVVLVGLGVRELSMTAASIPRVKAVLRGVAAEEARRLAGAAMGLSTAAAIEAMLRRELAPALTPAHTR
jgi:phosphoenolpyruvate-protein phosphotransferase (PTS system enzyme I)